jgi:2-iminobutanoate/2-iminopropanoate deaminase
MEPAGRRAPSTILLAVEPFPTRNDVRAVPDLPKHPKPLGPYSHCVVANGFVFISAQAPIVAGAKAGEWAAPDIGGQTRQSLKNIASILDELGLSMSSVVKTTVFLVDPADFPGMNEAYKESFPDEPPARSTAKLGIASPGLKVAIEAIAVYEPKQEE